MNTNNAQNKIRNAIEIARMKHSADIQNTKQFSNAYYYAVTMVRRCDEALKMDSDTAAWKHFAGL